MIPRSRLVALFWIVAGISGCSDSDSTSSNGQPDPVYIGEFIGDDIHPQYFGKDGVRCSGQGLLDQGFSGTLDRHSNIEFVGTAKPGGIPYDIYYFSHVANHGLYIIVMISDNCRYIGSYVVSDRPIRITDKEILFDYPKEYGNVIRFSSRYPPSKIWINGENHELFR